MTTTDVINTLRANGWRFERLNGNQGPKNMVLTNAPPGRILCTVCGEWVRHRAYLREHAWCKTCDRAYRAGYMRRWRVNRKEGTGKTINDDGS